MDAANQQACKCLQPVDGGESVTTAIQKDPRDAISRPKLFIKWAECSPVPWNLKLHCANTTGHENVLLTLLFKLYFLYTQETCRCNTSRLCLTLQSALFMMCDEDDQRWWNSSCCRWWICFLNYCMRSGFGGFSGCISQPEACDVSLQLRLRCDIRLERRLRGPIREERENGCEENRREAVQEEGALEAAHHRGTINQKFSFIKTHSNMP